MPVEIVENMGPIVVWRKELRPGSGGAGKYRGGLGQIVEFGTVDDSPYMLFAMYDRTRYPAIGRMGGENGQTGLVRIKNGRELSAKGAQLIQPGERLELLVPGGGGYGSPGERDTELQARDRLDELV